MASIPSLAGDVAHTTTGKTTSFATALQPYIAELPVDPENTLAETSDTCSASSGDCHFGWEGATATGAHSYCYYSNNANYGPLGGWYMLVYHLEDQHTSLDAIDGVGRCGSNSNPGVPGVFNYDGNDGYVITVGMDPNCP